MNDIILKADNIVKYFYEPEKFQVLKGISFEVQKGEFLALVGKSGCGKSTLMYLLSTMDTDYDGSLTIKDTLLTKQSQNQLALENVMIPALKLKRYSKEEIQEKAYKHLELLGLKDQALKNANKLSGGQQQRVAIARALINDPAIIMGDEPTGNLDTANTQIVFDIFRELAKERQQTIIAVTHDDDFAKNCDRIIEMKDGQIVNKQ